MANMISPTLMTKRAGAAPARPEDSARGVWRDYVSAGAQLPCPAAIPENCSSNRPFAA